MVLSLLFATAGCYLHASVKDVHLADLPPGTQIYVDTVEVADRLFQKDGFSPRIGTEIRDWLMGDIRSEYPRQFELVDESGWNSCVKCVSIEMAVTDFDTGNRALRALVGHGAGQPILTVVVFVKDKSGNVLGSGEVTSRLARGTIAGGTYDVHALTKHVADAIYNKLLKNGEGS